ncbi:MAG: hypothetical protein KAR81_00420 [Sulfurimonas sp.]|nr:hypothetical protein [Sulfurimonas sp.]
MSLKDNISMVKEELNSEEKFFEKAVMTEKFVKKYKKLMIASVVAVVAVVSANIVYDANENSKITAANTALTKLTKDSKDTHALDELKTSSPELYSVWMFSQAVANKDLESIKNIKNSKTLIIDDLANYELATDAGSLEEYASAQDAIYRDLALVQSAVMLLEVNKIEEAHNKLLKVSQDSSLNKLVKTLLHYGIK